MMEKAELLRVVGPGNLLDDEETLSKYSQDLSLVPSRKPSFVLRPQNSDQVQEIVKLAAGTGTPLIPVSSGEPRFRGDTVPVFGGVVLDLSGMDKIRMVDRKDRVAMIEPGVRFDHLQTRLAQEGLRIPMPLCPRATKSVVGSCLEREPHTMPRYHLDHCDPLLCNEVIFGTGDVFRTGEAGGPGSLEEQHQAGRRQKIAMGTQMNINRILQGAQGTLGVVTWSTVKCELKPQMQKPFLAGSEHLEPLLALACQLVRLRLGDEIFLLNNQNLALLMGVDRAQGERLREALPTWILFFCLSGLEFLPEERVAYQERDVREIAKNLGIPLHETLSDISAKQVLARACNPSPEPYWKLRFAGGCQDIPFITPLEKVTELVEVMLDQAVAGGFSPSTMGVYVQPVCQGHGQHCEFSLFYDPDDSKQRQKVKAVYLAAGRALMDRAAFFSRPYDLLADTVYNRDASTRDALRKLKNIFDPNHILNPGKLCF